MTQGDARAWEAAVDWVARLRDPAFAEWESFTAWLEAEPRHNDLYERAALADRDLGEMLASVTPARPANDNPAPVRRSAYRRLAGWSAAAGAMLVAVTAYPLIRGNTAYDVATAPGEQRTVTLADGTRIALNGGTRMTFHRGDTRFASLVAGEAAFTVVHDAGRPFTLETGGDRIQDVGTVFNVARGEGVTEIGVAEGAVLYNPAAEAVRLTAGHVLHVSSGGNRVIVGEAAPETIGAWRSGRLVYRGAPIGRIAADVSRYLGVAVMADPQVAGRTFDGIIILAHDPKRLMARLAPLLDVAARPSAQGWRLTSITRETP